MTTTMENKCECKVHNKQGKRQHETCRGDVRRVKVLSEDRSIDWGQWNYCEGAINKCKDQNLIVEAA